MSAMVIYAIGFIAGVLLFALGLVLGARADRREERMTRP
jgi:hypothetical protein